MSGAGAAGAGAAGANPVTQINPVASSGSGNVEIKQTLNQKAFLAAMLAAQDAATKINQHSQAIKNKYAAVIALKNKLEEDIRILKERDFFVFPSTRLIYINTVDRSDILVKAAFDDAGIVEHNSMQGTHVYREDQLPQMKAAMKKKIESIEASIKTDVPAEAAKLEKDEQIAEERVKLKEQVKKYDLILGVAAKIQKLLHDARSKIMGASVV